MKEGKKGKKEKTCNPIYGKMGMILLAAFLIAACVWISDNGKELEKNENGQEILKRNGYGEGDREESLNLQVGETEESVDITVTEKEYDEEQLEEAFRQAEGELETLILGENKSLSEVRSDLNLVTEIPDKSMEVSWELDNYEIMDVQGNIKQENLTEEGVLLGLKALITYKEESVLYEFYAHIFPPKQTKTEKLVSRIKSLVSEADEETKRESALILPQEADGQKIKWSYPTDFRAIEILFLGIFAAILLYVSEKQKHTKNEKEKKYQMRMDYPQIINRLTLYMGAGMTVRTAWFKTAEEYKKKRNKTGERAAYEEMIHTMYEIQRGKTEKECYENFGGRCGIASYRKFAAILSQNLQKGSRGLAEILKSEAAEAFEERKNMARKAGEEAGTKLLVPMFIMLAVVMAIMVIPAFLSIQI